ncbi:hypothetical protein BDF20DRAFT_853276 [Mycotypha africana]|uniref:uncharacterized protein n=1 Tax=Mycotypha africana TaxID=64632 RepID=UPI002300D788|nr:uncharacterized protein BDF20DRAFT_853276 [Mycotypha africana]KAI8987994.1 hypothetical protein BDF20DRAFT_853276 [Mycotypha africana]
MTSFANSCHFHRPLQTSDRNALLMYNNHHYPASSSSFSLMIIDKMLRQQPEGYLLDYITQEFESIISCPSLRSASSSSSSTTSSSTSSASTMGTRPDPFTPCSPYSSTSSSPHTPHAPRQDHDLLSLPLSPSPPPPAPFKFISHHYNRKYSQHHVDRPASGIPSPPYHNHHGHRHQATIPKSHIPFRYFVEHVIRRSRLDNGTLLASLCYAKRLREKLYTTSQGMEYTHHRIFLATLMVAAKYIHDTAIKNKYWTGYALHLFTGHEINLMETQLLQLLDYHLEIQLKEFEEVMQHVTHLYLKVHHYAHHAHPYHHHHPHHHEPHASLVQAKKSPYVTPILTHFTQTTTTTPTPTMLQQPPYPPQPYPPYHQNTIQPNSHYQHHQHRPQY